MNIVDGGASPRRGNQKYNRVA